MRQSDEASMDPAVQSVVCQLVALLTEGKPAPPLGFAPVERLLDLQVDGVRCLCVRIAARVTPVRVSLSPREREIARMVANGQTNHAIAEVLGISAWTVSTHLRRVFSKLQVNSRAAMVAAVLGAEAWHSLEPSPHAIAGSHLSATPVQGTHVRASHENATTEISGSPVSFQ